MVGPQLTKNGSDPCTNGRTVSAPRRGSSGIGGSSGALARRGAVSNDACMTREQVESAISSGAPFTLRMADGKEYVVPHRDYSSASSANLLRDSA
jgi:hypothetical protein